jgi:uncharacterized membrane protein
MATVADEDRIMRVWTPIILRTILIAATVALIGGMLAMAAQPPGYYVRRFRAVQAGIALHRQQNWSDIASTAAHGDPHSIMTIGLIILTLVPLGRVAFTFSLFLKQGDRIFVVATAYVLAGLIAGVMLGRIG